MRRMLLAATAAFIGLGLADATAASEPEGWPIPECTPSDIIQHDPAPDEEDAHRTFKPIAIRYTAGARPKAFDGMHVKLRVDESGRITCMFRKDAWFGSGPIQVTPERSEALGQLAQMRYAPFERGGNAVSAVVVERIDEEDLPAQHRPMPDVSLSQVKIQLRRGGCLGTCPAYKVDIDGSGLVRFDGDGFVDVRGTHGYRIPQEGVARLVEQARAADFWSMRERYEGGITDFPTTWVRFEMGGQVHEVEDYVGTLDGMPRVMLDLEEAIDKVARTNEFVALSDFALDALVAERFAFDSPEAAAMLARATDNEEQRNDAVLARLLALGAPVDAPAPDEGFEMGEPRPRRIEVALRMQRSVLVDALFEREDLGPRERPDRTKHQIAFEAAIEGGDALLAKQVWDYSARKPALTYVSNSDDGKRRKRAPVSLRLSARHRNDLPRWDGIAMMQWLDSLGVDLRASDAAGITLLHIAVESGDIAFIRWLLAQGLDPSAADEDNIPPMGYTDDEDIVLTLLEGGARAKDGLEDTAAEANWTRVLAWLQAHRAK